MRFPIVPLTLAAAVLLACPPPKESETSATTGESGDETIGHSSNSQSGTTGGGTSTTNTSNTTVPPDPTDGPDDTTTTGATSATSTTTPPGTTTTTTGEDCVPDPPEPQMCNKAKNAVEDDPNVIGASTGCTFICEPPDVPPNECDIFEQNCPEGQKCNAWSSDGDNSWDSTKCVPVFENPDPIGAPCTVEGSGVSGIDSCVKGAMCWGVDEMTGMGTCVEQCTCSLENPICSVTPGSSCTIANDAVLVLCLPSCDPLDANACTGGNVCVANPGDSSKFICVVDASGGEGQLGDPCEFTNACDPTLLCGGPQLLPDLCDQQALGCCVPFCDLSAVDCPPGASCLPWFEPGQAPKCFENIGVCGLEP